MDAAAEVVGSTDALAAGVVGSTAGRRTGLGAMPQEANTLTFQQANSREIPGPGPFVAIVRDREQMSVWLRARSAALQWIEVEGLLDDFEVWALAAEDTGEVPLDVVLVEPAQEFSNLYRLVDVRAGRDVRVTIPAKPGFLKAVRLAASLGLPVRLLPGQPADEVLDELQEALGFYLRDSMVDAPIEFFHSALAWLRGAPTGLLWQVLEEDPAIYQRDCARTSFSKITPDQNFVSRFLVQLTEAGAECATCPWQEFCGGYFKWPDAGYSCAGVKKLFSNLHAAVAEIEHDLSTFDPLSLELPFRS
jgi:hypothetical protein